MIDMIESEFCQHWRWFFVCVSAVQESKNIIMVILDAQFHSFDEASICNIWDKLLLNQWFGTKALLFVWRSNATILRMGFYGTCHCTTNTSSAFSTYNVLMEVLMTLVIDYSFVAFSHTAWATGSVDQSELRIHLFARRSTINDSLWTSCRRLFLVYPMGESYWWVCLLFWDTVPSWSISNLAMDMMDLGVAGELLVIWFAISTFWTSSPYLTWQWIWRIWVWYCFLCWDFVTSWPDVMAMHNDGLGCAWNGVISTWAMDMVDLGICLK